MNRPSPLTRAWRSLIRRATRVRLRVDEADQEALFDVLRELGAVVEERGWAVAGAVERGTYSITRGAEQGVMTIESYEGPVLVGDRALIDAVVAGLAARRRGRSGGREG